MTTWLITGANRGIGLAFARALTARGETVIATARHPDKAADLAATGARVEALDVTNPDSARALAHRLGGAGIDVLVNNAAVFLDKDATSAMDTTANALMDTLRANVAGPLLVTQALAGHIERSQRRQIVHISSDFASIDHARQQAWTGYLAYRASKAALSMAHVLLANELGPRGITSIALHPGWVQTDMGGAGATLTPEASVGAMLGVIDRVTPADNARFYSYTGEEVAW